MACWSCMCRFLGTECALHLPFPLSHTQTTPQPTTNVRQESRREERWPQPALEVTMDGMVSNKHSSLVSCLHANNFGKLSANSHRRGLKTAPEWHVARIP